MSCSCGQLLECYCGHAAAAGFPILRKLLGCSQSEPQSNIAGPVPALRAVTCLLLVIGLHSAPCQALTMPCRFEMRIHKRLIDLHSPAEVVKQITSIR